jgi:hypothetical protein
MVANLLTHSNLLRGIARSGAYNRTLTLAFSQSSAITGRYLNLQYHVSIYECEQNENPLYWCMGKPIIILEHSLYKRSYFQALKGLGAPVRMVILPKEAHGYAAKENILHLLWEQDQFRKISEELLTKAPKY